MSSFLTGLAADTAAHLKENLRQLLMWFMTDELMHARALAGGKYDFRRLFAKDMGAFYNGNRSRCDDVADGIFTFLEKNWRERHGVGVSPEMWLNGYTPPPSGPTQQEIDDAWQVEIGSSEDAMNLSYEGSARIRKGADLGMRDVDGKGLADWMKGRVH